MSLEFTTGVPPIDNDIAEYNRRAGVGNPGRDGLDLLERIRGAIGSFIAGRRALRMMDACSRERHAMLAQAESRQRQATAARRPPPTPTRRHGPLDTFVAHFNKATDLIYGRSGEEFRDKYVLAVSPDGWEKVSVDTAHLRMQPAQDMDFVMIDIYNNAFLGTEIFAAGRVMAQGDRQDKKNRRKAIEPIHNAAADLATSNSYRGKLDGEHPEVGNFREFLENETTYNIGEVGGPEGQQMRYGRACKAGMAYGVLRRKGRIHFVLDGITSKSVLDDLQKGKDKRLITGKELRWLFRHRDDTRIKEEILFWRAGAIVRPLWEEDAAEWQAYGQELETRTAARGTTGTRAFGGT